MEKTYNPQDIEQPLYEHWEKQGYFKPNGDESKESFCIMIPPPNVTGSLHMGHAFQQTIMDTMIRYQRMQGKNTLWQAGTDHAGIATQMVVERKIAAEEGKTRHTKFDAWQFPTLAWGDPTLPSALRRFTSEFGMGSGGTTALQPPGKFCLLTRFSPVNLICIRLKIFSNPPKHLRRCKVKPHGSLVSVSSMYRYTYTPDLSTSSSSTFLQETQSLRENSSRGKFRA